MASVTIKYSYEQVYTSVADKTITVQILAGSDGGGGVTNHSELVLDDGTNPHGTTVGYNELKGELKNTYNQNTTNINWIDGVAFKVPELTSDIVFTFSNVQENKQIKITLKGSYSFTLPSNVDVSDISYDGTVWNVLIMEATNINGAIQIKAFSLV